MTRDWKQEGKRETQEEANQKNRSDRGQRTSRTPVSLTFISMSEENRVYSIIVKGARRRWGTRIKKKDRNLEEATKKEEEKLRGKHLNHS